MKLKCGLRTSKSSKDPVSIIGKGVSNIDILKKETSELVKQNCNDCSGNTKQYKALQNKEKKYIKF